MTPDQIRGRIEELNPWFYRFDFGSGLQTKPAIPEAVEQIFETRLRMVTPVVDAHFGSRLSSVECLDIGCHEGFYSIAMKRHGVARVLGVDAREDNLQRARFVAEAMGIGNVEYRRSLVESLGAELGRTFPLTLFLGVLYHVEDPMRCLRNVAAVTDELCVLETQVIAEVDGFAEWGSKEWTRPYRGVLALIDESGEFHAGNRETGVTPVATCPSPRALLFMLQQAGFRKAVIVQPPPGAYEQHARGQRVVCAAWK